MSKNSKSWYDLYNILLVSYTGREEKKEEEKGSGDSFQLEVVEGVAKILNSLKMNDLLGLSIVLHSQHD